MTSLPIPAARMAVRAGGRLVIAVDGKTVGIVWLGEYHAASRERRRTIHNRKSKDRRSRLHLPTYG
jgi:hypothetical protein